MHDNIRDSISIRKSRYTHLNTPQEVEIHQFSHVTAKQSKMCVSMIIVRQCAQVLYLWGGLLENGGYNIY